MPQDPIEKQLSNLAEKIAIKNNWEAPVMLIVGGTGKPPLERTKMGVHFPSDSRHRDILGILQTVIQHESLKHFMPQMLANILKITKKMPTEPD